MEKIIQTPRYVTCINCDLDNGNLKEYSWQQDKVHIEQNLSDDLLMLQNVFEGKILSPSVYPLIYETKTAPKEIALRSLEFYREVDQDYSLYTTLSAEEKLYFLIGIRDLFVAACRNLLSVEEKELLKRLAGRIEPDVEGGENIVSKEINNLHVTPYPTAKNKMVRFMDEKTESVPDEYFIRNELNLMMVFVDPRELSYHNFENIINLDSVFVKNSPQFAINNVEKHPQHEVYTFEMTDQAQVLLSLDSFGLYTQPLNKLSRGGERFIFSSEALSKTLTHCILTNIQPHQPLLINNKFRFVNYVFRYNKFRPSDHKFTSHYDTPYYDPVKKHYSKYTLILYLTSGAAEEESPILSIDKGNVIFTSIDIKVQGQIRGVIFDQKYEHEGRSFLTGDKIFLRSELVYEFDEEDELRFDVEVSKKFNIACYMTKHSVFNDELEKYASECFDQAAKARLNLAKNGLIKDRLIYKRYRDTSFITNGYDYWFLNSTSLEDAGIITLLDYFNCKFESEAYFNKLVYSKTMNLDVINGNDIYGHLTRYSKDGALGEEIKVEIESDINDKEDEINRKRDYNEMLYNLPNKAQDSDEDKLELEKKRKMDTDKVEGIVQTKPQAHLDNSKYLFSTNSKNETNIEQEDEDQEKDEDEDDHDEDEDKDEDEDEDGDQCCPLHVSCFDPNRCSDVQYCYEEKKEKYYNKIAKFREQFPIIISDEEIEIDKKQIVITEDSIIFGNQMPSINFASCWTGGAAEDYVDSFLRDLPAYTNIPPISYRTSEKGHHLRIELFNNSFVRRVETKVKDYKILG